MRTLEKICIRLIRNICVMESEEFVGYENNNSISNENAFIQDVDDDDSETMNRQETEETPVKKSRTL